MKNLPKKLQIPFEVKAVNQDEDLPENIKIKYSFKHNFESLYALYFKVQLKTIFGKIYYIYRLKEIEYVPGFVGIKKACFGYYDYDFKLDASLLKRKIKAQYIPTVEYKSKKLIFNLETHEKFLQTNFNTVPYDIFDHWD